MTSVLDLPVAEQYPSSTDTSGAGSSKRISHMSVTGSGAKKSRAARGIRTPPGTKARARMEGIGAGAGEGFWHGHAPTVPWLRRTSHSTSGRSSSQVTTPAVILSIAGQCSAGNFRLPSLQKQTACGLTPSRTAAFDGPPSRSMAARIEVMPGILRV